MYGHPNRFGPYGGGRPQQTAAPPINRFGTFQNPNIFSQTVPTSSPHPQVQNQTFHIQNPIWPFQQNPSLQVQNIDGFPPQQLPVSLVQSPSSSQNPKEHIEKIDRAVAKARNNLLTVGESVTVWKVSQKALLILQVDSWSSLGIKMQQVPSLHRLMIIEGKV